VHFEQGKLLQSRTLHKKRVTDTEFARTYF